MQIRYPALTAVAVLGLAVASASAQTGPVLSGTVSSAEEGKMEGVLVSAKLQGSTITTTVVSDAQGHYAHSPPDVSEPGSYAISIRAVGYDLRRAEDGNRHRRRNPGSDVADLALAKTKNLAGQLSNAEWIMSAPGPDQQKAFLTNCVGCHTVQRLFQSTHADASRAEHAVDAYGGLFAGLDAAQAAALAEPVAARLRAAPGSGGELFRDHQSQHHADLELRAEDPAASQGARHQGDRHRVRSAAPGGDAARRRGRCRRDALVLRFRQPVRRPARSRRPAR